MSPSARRLVGDVTTNRFDWQAADPLGNRLASQEGQLLGASPSPLTPVMRDLPSPTAERQQAIERDAFAKGFAQGERAGEAAAAARIEATLQRLAATIEEISSLRGGLMRRSEREMVRLSVAIAERVLHREVQIDREVLLAMARSAVDRLGQQVVATVHLNPADAAVIAARRGPDAAGTVQVVEDANVPRGGCLVRSSAGHVNASIEAQVRELARALLGEHADEEDGCAADTHR